MRFKNGKSGNTVYSLVCLKLPGVFVLPKIAKGVEGGGDLSVRTLVCSRIAVEAIGRSQAARTQ